MFFRRFRQRPGAHAEAVRSKGGQRKAPRSRSRLPRRLLTESLEQRQLMSVSPLLPEMPMASCTCLIGPPAANMAPAARDDAYAINGHQQLGANVLANDTDVDGDALGAVLVRGPRHGKLDLDNSGLFTYTPNRRFDGMDTFIYRSNDGQLRSNPARVSINVARVNDPPIAVNDVFSTMEEQPLGVPAESGLLANDRDANGDLLTASLVQGPRNGVLRLQADGAWSYVPNPGFHGTDTFTYRASDGQVESSPATVTLAVVAVDEAPAAADDFYRVDENEILSVGGPGVLANDTDAEGDALTPILVTGPENGTLALGDDGSLEYAPNAGFYGTDIFTYKVNDGQADSNVATVTIKIAAINSAPTAADDAYATQQDEALVVAADGVLANDQDADGDALTAAVVDGPANGTLALGADGSFRYTPNAGFHGTDRFTYKANDGQADSGIATVTVAVEAPAKAMEVELEVSGSAFGPDSGPIWGGSTFWVNAYVEDVRDVPQGVVGGAIDLNYDASRVTPTGNVVYGSQFADYRQGSGGTAAGMIDEAGALATEAGVGAEGAAPFIAWEFRRSGVGAPNDANSQVSFSVDPGEGTGTIMPSNFALVGLGTPVDWQNVAFDTVNLDLNLGDFNSDGEVNQFDLALWIPQAASSPGGAAFDPRFDLDGDVRVNAGDRALLMPRLYQPVQGNAGPAVAAVGDAAPSASPDSAPRACDHSHHSSSHVASRFRQSARDGAWLDSLTEQVLRGRGGQQRFAAIDHVLLAY